MNIERLINSISRFMFSHLLSFCSARGTGCIWALFTLPSEGLLQEQQTYWRGFCQQHSLNCWKKNTSPKAEECLAWTQRWNFLFFSYFQIVGPVMFKLYPNVCAARWTMRLLGFDQINHKPGWAHVIPDALSPNLQEEAHSVWRGMERPSLIEQE